MSIELYFFLMYSTETSLVWWFSSFIVLVLKSGVVKFYTYDTESNVCFMESKLEAAKKCKNSGY